MAAVVLVGASHLHRPVVRVLGIRAFDFEAPGGNKQEFASARCSDDRSSTIAMVDFACVPIDLVD